MVGGGGGGGGGGGIERGKVFVCISLFSLYIASLFLLLM